MLENFKTSCRKIDISQRDQYDPLDCDFDSLIPETQVAVEDESTLQALAQKQKETQGMDALPLDLFNQMLENCAERRDFRSVFWLVAMANFGLRYSDVVKLRYIDLIDEHNKMRDSILLQEKKTSKQRIVFINQAVKMALLMHLWNGDFSPTDYLIYSEGRRKGYEFEMVRNSKGRMVAVKDNHGKIVFKYDEYGRKIPKPLSRSQSELIMKGIIIDNLGLALKNDARCKDMDDPIGKICTHSIRKLYGWAVTNAFIEKFDSDVAYAHSAALSFLSQDYGHSSETMTLHYSNDFRELKREINMQMNLGAEVLRPFFEAEKQKFLAR